MRILFTTNPGIEDVAAFEVKSKLHAKNINYKSKRGRIVADIDDEDLYLINNLRSIHKSRILLHEGKICREPKCLTEVSTIVSSIGPELEQYITANTSFAIRVERAGNHEYNSMDIAREAGSAIQKYFYTKYGVAPRVDLDYPNIIVAIDVIEDLISIGIELAGDLSWHRRGYRIYEHPAALKPTLAYAMLLLVGLKDAESFMDPMCGGGTIAIEAAFLTESSPIFCNDINVKYLKGAALNARAAGVRTRIFFTNLDARELHKYYKNIDRIATNPPYGIRMGSPRQVKRLYKEFITSLSMILAKKAAVITTEDQIVEEAAEDVGLRISHIRQVAHGGLWPKIIILE